MKKILTLLFLTIILINTNKIVSQPKRTFQPSIIAYWMERGVHFECPDFVYIDPTVTIGPGTCIGCGVHLLGDTVVGADCIIEAFCIIADSIIEDEVIVFSHSRIDDAHIGVRAKIGPFARLRDNSQLEEGSEVGNFVEIARSTIGQHTKAKHLSYLGKTTTGPRVNIGAGTITCNYDGVNKHETFIGEGAFVGSNTCLLAPITIGKRAIIGASSVINENVEDDALAICRVRKQTNKKNYAPKLRKRYKKQSK